MKTVMITIGTGIIGIIGATVWLLLMLIVSSIVLSELIPAQTFGYYSRPLALLILICAGVYFGWLGHTLATGQD